MTYSKLQDLDALYPTLSERNLAALWLVLAKLVPASPTSPAVPSIWRYDEVRPLLILAGQLIDTENAERRVLMLENPGMPGQARTTGSLYGGLQLILPGERARPHRHSASALRFVIEGVGAWTTVSGEKTQMNPGDFVVTPSWAWHEHGNDGSEPVIWLDGLDIHLVNLLDCGFREDSFIRESRRPVSTLAKTDGFEAKALPTGTPPSEAPLPIINYPYEQTRTSLLEISGARSIDPFNGYQLRYANPLNGDWAIPTIATWVRFFPSGFRSLPNRSTDATINVVVEGSGCSTIGGNPFAWKSKDVFIVPAWTEVIHHASTDAVVFSASDRAAQEKLGLWREERNPKDPNSSNAPRH